jgi:hypothetical protein
MTLQLLQGAVSSAVSDSISKLGQDRRFDIMMKQHSRATATKFGFSGARLYEGQQAVSFISDDTRLVVLAF